MATYRAYRVDNKRHIQNGTWLEASNDGEAKAQASELCDQEAPVIELWQSTRLVGEIDCADDG